MSTAKFSSLVMKETKNLSKGELQSGNKAEELTQPCMPVCALACAFVNPGISG